MQMKAGTIIGSTDELSAANTMWMVREVYDYLMGRPLTTM